MKSPEPTSPHTSKENEMHEGMKALFGGLLTGAVVGTAYHKYLRKAYLLFSVYDDTDSKGQPKIRDTTDTADMKAIGIERMSVSAFYLRMFKLCVQYGKCSGRSHARATDDETRQANSAPGTAVAAAAPGKAGALRAAAAPGKAVANGAPGKAVANGAPGKAVAAGAPGKAVAVAAPGKAGAAAPPPTANDSEFQDEDNVLHSLGRKVEELEGTARRVFGEVEGKVDEALGGQKEHACPTLCQALLTMLPDDYLHKSGPLMYIKKLLRNTRLTILVQYEGTTPPDSLKYLCSLLTLCFNQADEHSEVIFQGPLEHGQLLDMKKAIETKVGKLELATLKEDVIREQRKAHLVRTLAVKGRTMAKPAIDSKAAAAQAAEEAGRIKKEKEDINAFIKKKEVETKERAKVREEMDVKKLEKLQERRMEQPPLVAAFNQLHEKLGA